MITALIVLVIPSKTNWESGVGRVNLIKQDNVLFWQINDWIHKNRTGAFTNKDSVIFARGISKGTGEPILFCKCRQQSVYLSALIEYRSSHFHGGIAHVVHNEFNLDGI